MTSKGRFISLMTKWGGVSCCYAILGYVARSSLSGAGYRLVRGIDVGLSTKGARLGVEWRNPYNARTEFLKKVL